MFRVQQIIYAGDKYDKKAYIYLDKLVVILLLRLWLLNFIRKETSFQNASSFSIGY